MESIIDILDILDLEAFSCHPNAYVCRHPDIPIKILQLNYLNIVNKRNLKLINSSPYLVS